MPWNCLKRSWRKKIVYFCLPFTGHHWLHIRSQHSKVLASTYLHISIRVAFRPSCRLSSFFPFKDRIPIALRSHVVYQFTCQWRSYMLAKHADTFTHVSQSIWESRLWLEKNGLSQPCLVYSLTSTCTNTQSPLLISKSYHQALMSGIVLSVKASLLISQFNPVLNLILNQPLSSYFSYVILTLTYTNHALNINLYLLTSYW
jgi:hypothetical protein